MKFLDLHTPYGENVMFNLDNITHFVFYDTKTKVYTIGNEIPVFVKETKEEIIQIIKVLCE